MADLVVPQVGESVSEGILAKWLKQVGDAVAADEPVAELETDKVTVQVLSPVAGALSEQRAKEGATVKVGESIGAVEAGKAGKAAAKPAPAAAAASAKPAPQQQAQAAAGATQTAAQPAPAKAPPPTPPAKPAQAKSGNGESLDKDKLLRLTPSQRATARETGNIPQPSSSGGSASAAPSGPSVEERLAHVDPRDEIVPMSPLRKRVAERLVQAQHESASLTTFNEVDMTAVMDLRAKYKETFEKAHGAKLGFMSFFV
ncbi:MAG TPA: biotin/lipoyl-containing protein, partial [Kofleriaceae bacterium]|nr:biotin/lipoyl-containing protein [Kofleriaceae bacterium]